MGRIPLAGTDSATGLLRLDHLLDRDRAGDQPDHRALAALAGRRRDDLRARARLDRHTASTVLKEHALRNHEQHLTIAVIGAGGKMGLRDGDNLAKTDHTRPVGGELARRPGAARRCGAHRDDRCRCGRPAPTSSSSPCPISRSARSSHELVPQAKSGRDRVDARSGRGLRGTARERDDIMYAVRTRVIPRSSCSARRPRSGQTRSAESPPRRTRSPSVESDVRRTRTRGSKK